MKIKTMRKKNQQIGDAGAALVEWLGFVIGVVVVGALWLLS